MKFNFDRRWINSESIYLIALTIYVSAACFQATYLYNVLAAAGSPALTVLQLLRYAAYGLCALKIILSYTGKPWEFFLVAALFGISAMAAVFGTDKALLFNMLFIYGAKKVDFRKILWVFFLAQLATFLFCLLCAFGFGLGSESVNSSGRTRFYLGFGWVNRPGYFALAMLMEYVCLRKGKFTFPEYAAFLAVFVLIYTKTVTRYALVLSVLIATVFLVINTFRETRPGAENPRFRVGQWEFSLFQILLIVFAVGSIALHNSFNWNSDLMRSLNSMLTDRLNLGKQAISRYGFHLFGSKTVWVGSSTMIWGLGESNKYFYVDCGFLQFALDYGLVALTMIVLLYERGLHRATALKEYYIMDCILLIGFVAVFEPRLVDFTFNPFILYAPEAVSTVRRRVLKGR